MATTQRASSRRSSLPSSKDEKKEKKHHSGRKWYFAKTENGQVRTLHHHNKSPILTQDGTDPGFVVQIKPTGDDLSKLKVCFITCWPLYF